MTKTLQTLEQLRTVSAQQRETLQRELAAALAQTQNDINACLRSLGSDVKNATDTATAQIDALQQQMTALAAANNEAVAQMEGVWAEVSEAGRERAIIEAMKSARARAWTRIIPLIAIGAVMMGAGGAMVYLAERTRANNERTITEIAGREAAMAEQQALLERLTVSMRRANGGRYNQCPDNPTTLCVKVTAENTVTAGSASYVRITTPETPLAK